MHAKHCSVDHPAVTLNVKNDSNIWKCILSVRNIAEPHIKRVIGKGEIDAYRDQWYSSNILQLTDALKPNSCFNQDGSPIDLIITCYLGPKGLAEIHSKGILLLISMMLAIGTDLTLATLVYPLLSNWLDKKDKIL